MKKLAFLLLLLTPSISLAFYTDGPLPSLDGLFMMMYFTLISVPALISSIIFYLAYRIILSKKPEKINLIKVLRFLWILSFAIIIFGLLFGLYLEMGAPF